MDLNSESLYLKVKKVLLENHSKGLLMSKKLQELRSGPYTVQHMLNNTTCEIQHDKTNEKKTVHRNHIVPYYPKEEKIQELVENNVVPDDSDNYYTQYNKHIIAKSNAHIGAQQNDISQWLLLETQDTANPSTTLQPTFNVEATPTKDTLYKICIRLIAHNKKIFPTHQIILLNLKLHVNYSLKKRITAPHHHRIILHQQLHLKNLI